MFNRKKSDTRERVFDAALVAARITEDAHFWMMETNILREQVKSTLVAGNVFTLHTFDTTKYRGAFEREIRQDDVIIIQNAVDIATSAFVFPARVHLKYHKEGGYLTAHIMPAR